MKTIIIVAFIFSFLNLAAYSTSYTDTALINKLAELDENGFAKNYMKDGKVVEHSAANKAIFLEMRNKETAAKNVRASLKGMKNNSIDNMTMPEIKETIKKILDILVDREEKAE